MRTQLTAGGGDPLELVARAKEASSQAIADLRTVVYSLRPPALDDLGVVGAIAAQGRRMAESSSVDIELESDGLPALPAAVEVVLFRIASEGVTNVVRHAEARSCRVLLGGVDGRAFVEVGDDGAFDRPHTPGVGTVSMRERFTELGGSLEMGPTGEGGRLRASARRSCSPEKAGSADPSRHRRDAHAHLQVVLCSWQRGGPITLARDRRMGAGAAVGAQTNERWRLTLKDAGGRSRRSAAVFGDY